MHLKNIFEEFKQIIPMYMKDWIEKLNGFLTLNDREILNNACSISHELAKENAESEYEKFNSSEKNVR